MVKRVWPSPELEIVETLEFDIPPVGKNLLDAYLASWVLVGGFRSSQRPVNVHGYGRRY